MQPIIIQLTLLPSRLHASFLWFLSSVISMLCCRYTEREPTAVPPIPKGHQLKSTFGSSQCFPLISNCWRDLTSSLTCNRPTWVIQTEAPEWDRVIPSKRKETPAQVFLQGDASERVFSPSVDATWLQPSLPAIWRFHHYHLWIANLWPLYMRWYFLLIYIVPFSQGENGTMTF